MTDLSAIGQFALTCLATLVALALGLQVYGLKRDLNTALELVHEGTEISHDLAGQLDGLRGQNLELLEENSLMRFHFSVCPEVQEDLRNKAKAQRADDMIRANTLGDRKIV